MGIESSVTSTMPYGTSAQLCFFIVFETSDTLTATPAVCNNKLINVADTYILKSRYKLLESVYVNV